MMVNHWYIINGQFQLGMVRFTTLDCEGKTMATKKWSSLLQSRMVYYQQLQGGAPQL